MMSPPTFKTYYYEQIQENLLENANEMAAGKGGNPEEKEGEEQVEDGLLSQFIGGVLMLANLWAGENENLNKKDANEDIEQVKTLYQGCHIIK